jgi:hypothetical protein
MIAMEEKDYDKAIGELQQANQQNPLRSVSLEPGVSRER